MRVTVFTSNQPRHFKLIEKLCRVADEVFAIQECTTLYPGKRADYYPKTEVMERYFARVLAAEAEVFGQIAFPPANCRQLPLFLGDLNFLSPDVLAEALEADYIVVFGASYVKGALVDSLIAKRTINIHIGASPYYRGNSCNFWALHDQKADYVSGTIHMLTKGLDSGPILYHALPAPAQHDPFKLGMLSVSVAQDSVCHHIASGTLYAADPVPQDRSQELRYTKNSEFDDEVAQRYLDALPTPELIRKQLDQRDLSRFVRPYVG
jgi:hypothetical protein